MLPTDEELESAMHMGGDTDDVYHDADEDDAMPSAEGPSTSFLQVGDKPLPADVEIASWCPTMDLLVLVTADSQISCLRFNWQKLWWVPGIP